jgi:hypothetical protein
MTSAAATTSEELPTSTEPSTWFGTTIDMHAVRRDAVLAGVFTALNLLAGTLVWTYLPMGLLFGAGIGAILHVMPAEPRRGDSRRGRIIVRGLSGLVGGAWAGAGVAVVASGTFMHANIPQPQPAELWQEALVGAITGLAWYVIWGIWETREGAPRSG